jgi:hypothetical protein
MATSRFKGKLVTIISEYQFTFEERQYLIRQETTLADDKQSIKIHDSSGEEVEERMDDIMNAFN